MHFVQFSRVLCICTILFMFVTKSNSAVSHVANTEDADHPGLCHYKGELSSDENKIDLFLKPGETKKHPKECFEINCGNNFEIQIYTCSIIGVPDGCTKVEGKNTDPYPKCCGDIECKQN